MTDKIEILVPPARHKKPKGGSSGRKVALGRRRGTHDLARRRHVKQGINFYDMGQISDGHGGWVDTNFQIPRMPDQTGDILTPQQPLVTDYGDRDTPLFLISTGDWKTKFRKVTKGGLSEKYGIIAEFGAFDDFLDNLTQWSSGGLTVTQSDLNSGLLAASDPPLFFEFFTLLDGQPNVKITGSQLYTDSSVAFTPAPIMDVFFPPRLVFLRGRAKTSTFGDRGDFGELYLTFPRRFIINTTDDYFGGDISSEPATGAGMDTQTNNAIDNWKSLISGREYFYDFASNTWAAGAFPPAGTTGKGIAPQGVPVQDFGLNGNLIAVVKKGSSFYYFWTDGF